MSSAVSIQANAEHMSSKEPIIYDDLEYNLEEFKIRNVMTSWKRVTSLTL